jgi:DNA-binding MarR family transcriptional regulator
MSIGKAPVARSLAPVSLQQRAAVALGRAVSAQVHRLEQALKPFELTPTQYNVLRILNGARGGLCSADIGERLISQGPDVTRLLDRMADAGLVERERDPHNRRFVTTRITDAGWEKLHETTPIVDAALREHYRGFTRAQLNALLEAFPDPYGTD